MITIFWAGDSTVKQNSILTYPQTGIGQAFNRYVKRDAVRVENHAENGRSTKQFIDEGRLAVIYDRMTEGDFLFIQFGHNDEKIADPARYADPDGEFAANLERFVNAAQGKRATPVLITPLTREGFQSPDASFRHGPWAESMRRTAKRLGVALVDLTAMSEALVEQLDEASRERLYMHLPAGAYPYYPEGKEDGTHLQTLGALVFGGLIARGLYALGGPYEALLDDECVQWIRETENERAAWASVEGGR